MIGCGKKDEAVDKAPEVSGGQATPPAAKGGGNEDKAHAGKPAAVGLEPGVNNGVKIEAGTKVGGGGSKE